MARVCDERVGFRVQSALVARMRVLAEDREIPVTASAVARHAMEIGVEVLEEQARRAERTSAVARARAYLAHAFVPDDVDRGRCMRCGETPPAEAHLREGETREARIATWGH